MLKRDYRFCASASVTLYDDEEEKPDRDRKEYHLQREEGDAEAALDRVSSQRERSGRSGRQRRAPPQKR
jgi:hypothetical protein